MSEKRRQRKMRKAEDKLLRIIKWIAVIGGFYVVKECFGVLIAILLLLLIVFA